MLEITSREIKENYDQLKAWWINIADIVLRKVILEHHIIINILYLAARRDAIPLQ